MKPAAFAILCLAAALPASAADEPSYFSAAVVFPRQGEAVRANGGRLRVAVRIAPKLRPGHRIQLLLDGVAAGPPQTAPPFQLIDLERGAHSLRIRILDAAGGVLFVGESTEFHLLRHSVLH